MRWLSLVPALLLSACAGDGGSDGGDDEPICDGQLQASEGDVADTPFDGDGDGYVDGSNPDCAAAYGANGLDCDDSDPDVNPGMVETLCNDVDEDCNVDTPDRPDFDQDGFAACDDCADDDPYSNPEATEVCWDGADNDCDEVVDEDCGPDYNGSFALDQTIEYKCLVGTIDVSFESVTFVYEPPTTTMFPVGLGLHPTTMSGTLTPEGDFDLTAEGYIPATTGACDETYYFQGSFTDADTFVGDFFIDFTGGFACFSCEDQLFTGITGTRTASP